MHRTVRSSAASFALFLAGCVAGAAPRPTALDVAAAQPPVAKKEPHQASFPGETVTDDYWWLRNKGSPEVEAYLNAENAYAEAVMKPTLGLQETLYKELVGRIKETDATVPARKGGYFYYSRTEKGKQYPILCRKKGSPDAPEEVYLDVNELAKGEKFMSLGRSAVSDDDQLYAYTTDNTGFRQYRLRFKDLAGQRQFPESIERVTSVDWAADGKTVFYTVEDPVAKRSHRLYRHALGTPTEQDALLYEEKDERFEVRVERTRSKRFLMMEIQSHTTSEQRILSAAEPLGEFKQIAPREQDHEYYADDGGDALYIRTNSGGRNFRLVKSPLGTTDRSKWQEIVPHRDDVMLADFDVFQGHLVLLERADGLPVVRVMDRKTGAVSSIAMADPVYSVFPADNFEYAPRALRLKYESPTTPESTIDYDLATQAQKLLKRQEVLGGFDAKNYEAERIHATAADGAKVPISIVHRKGAPRDGSAPLFLYSYGSYGISLNVGFSSNLVSLLDRGVVVAFAHIRGGGDLGKKWHDAGRMMNKRNTFTDFIAAAEYLVSQKHTATDRLLIEGGSAGGLLMGAVTNLRPDLFQAVVALVPFVDVLNTMNDETLPLTVGEFEEWGNPKVKEQYEYMKTYSPYENVAARSYPAILVRTSYNDSQVMYWEPAKYVAKMRALKTDHHPLVFRCDMSPAGHGGKSGRYERLRQTAYDYAFVLSAVAHALK